MLLGRKGIVSSEPLAKTVVGDHYYNWKEVRFNTFELRIFFYCVESNEFVLIKSVCIKSEYRSRSKFILINERYGILIERKPFILDLKLGSKSDICYDFDSVIQTSSLLFRSYSMYDSLFVVFKSIIRCSLVIPEDADEHPFFTDKHALVGEEVFAFDVTPGKNRFIMLDDGVFVYYNSDGRFEPIQVELPTTLPSDYFFVNEGLVFFYDSKSFLYYDTQCKELIKDGSTLQLKQMLDINNEIFFFRQGSYFPLLDSIKQIDHTSFSIANNQVWKVYDGEIPYFEQNSVKKLFLNPFSEEIAFKNCTGIMQVKPFYDGNCWTLQYIKKVEKDHHFFVDSTRVFSSQEISFFHNISFNDLYLIHKVDNMIHINDIVLQERELLNVKDIIVIRDKLWTMYENSVIIRSLDELGSILSSKELVFNNRILMQMKVNSYCADQAIIQGHAHNDERLTWIYFVELVEGDFEQKFIRVVEHSNVVFVDTSVVVLRNSVYIFNSSKQRVLELPVFEGSAYCYSPKPGVYSRLFLHTYNLAMKKELFVFNSDYTGFELHIEEINLRNIIESTEVINL
ncbi:hypothetical protein PCE1_002966 [Barthelona sp. PCE]